MKLFVIIFIITLIGCSQINPTENKVETVQTIDTVAKIEILKAVPEFPAWLTLIYPTEIKLKYRIIGQELTDFKELNDSVSYCAFKQMDGVCTKFFLKTYTNRTQTDSLLLGENCDHDHSQPTYSWKEFELKPLNIILTSGYTESVNDSLIDENGRMRKEYDFIEAETIIDTITQMYQIDQKGMIKEINNL